MNNLRISSRLALGFSLVLLLLSVIVGIGLQRLQQSIDAVNDLRELQTRTDMAATWMAKTQVNVTRVIAQAKAAGTGDMVAYFAPQIAKTTAEISELQKTLQEQVKSEEGKAMLVKIGEHRKAYIAAREAVNKAVKAGDLESAAYELTSSLVPKADAYVGMMVEFQKLQVDMSRRHAEEVQAGLASAQKLVVGLLVASLLLGAWLAWTITRSITVPLGEAMAAAAAIAQSDLSRTIVTSRRDELGDLLRTLAAMQGSLRGVVGRVRSATDSIFTASGEIASGNADLSGRTEQTASSLEETASAMEQLNGTVKQSADSARTANQLASSAAQVAQRGGTVVAQVVSTMDDITTSSKKISDIIGVIDGIAFQTNILALNAAVEAARAGEQGRGFAVVASEVRSLAQRSAGAAKEIKALIGASVERVESGSKLVADAGSTMSEIVNSVQKVADMIAEISAAAGEQSDGIGQVNIAVNQLDQMTQQNSALVEQSAAAADSLKDQARDLTELMSTFRLATNEAAAAPTAAAMPQNPAPAPAKPAPKATPRVLPKAAAAAAPAPKPAAPAKATPPAATAAASESEWETF